MNVAVTSNILGGEGRSVVGLPVFAQGSSLWWPRNNLSQAEPRTAGEPPGMEDATSFRGFI